MEQLSTSVTKFDVSFILKHYLRPALWGKRWKIFKYGNYAIYIQMYAIYTYNKTVCLRLEVKDDEWQYSGQTSYLYFNINEENINEIANKNRLDGEILRLINEYEKESLITENELYASALEAEEEHSKMIKRLANEYLDELGITDKKVRESYIKDQAYENKANYTKQVVEKLEYTLIPELYLSYSLFADNKQKYDSYLRLIESQNEELDIESLQKEIEDVTSKIEAGEMDSTITLEEIDEE